MSSTPATPKGPSSIPTPKSRRGMKGFFAEVGREMKKVTWPTKQETNRLTLVVFSVCFIICSILFVLSYVFERAVNLITKGSI
jgi:preprotein translocase subunit SecE